MNCTPEQLHERIVAAISRELHLADVRHEQETIHYAAYCNRDDLPPEMMETRYDSETGLPYKVANIGLGDAMRGAWGTLFGREAQ